jgi:hypothetical protein
VPKKLKVQMRSVRKTGGLAGLDSSFIANIGGEIRTCEKFRGRNGKTEIRCKAQGAGSKKGGTKYPRAAAYKGTRPKTRSVRKRAGMLATKTVSRSAALVKSGPKKGKLKKGCRFLKNGMARCDTKGTPRPRKKARRRRR